MNQPSNPNKITAIIMIGLAFSLMFIIYASIQSYKNGEQAAINGQIGTENTKVIKETVGYLKSTSYTALQINNETNNILKQFNATVADQALQTKNIINNSKVFRQMLDQLEQINNKTTK